MVSVHPFPIRRLRQPEFRSFCTQTSRILTSNYVTRMPKRAAKFIAAQSEFCEVLSERKPSLIPLSELDSTCDESWKGFVKQVAASMKHPREEVREAAKVLNDVIEAVGKPTERGYDQAYGMIDDAVTQIDKLDAQLLVVARVDEHYSYLKDSYTAFIDARHENNQTKSTIVSGKSRELRENVTKAYTLLTQMLEVYADDDPISEKIIAELNEVIDSTKVYLARREKLESNENRTESSAVDNESK